MSKNQKTDSTKSRDEVQAEKIQRSQEFFVLYKDGHTYQSIGDTYEITRERVRQILSSNRGFEAYQREQKRIRTQAKIDAKERRKELARQQLLDNSLAYLFPERIEELWDHAKNGSLKPEEIHAGSTKQKIWLLCPVDGYSWRKTARDISFYSWERAGTSGCPKCAGKLKKRVAQPKLIERYKEFVDQYWNIEKNTIEELYPTELTLGSNQKVWLKCPVDGNEWKVQVAAMVKQQWSKGNAGCTVCNGTSQKKRGKWQKAPTLEEAFPNQLAKFWDYSKNTAEKLEPKKLTIGSSRLAYFKCPKDGHEWIATIAAITKGSWARGNTGCPACRGIVVTNKNSIATLFTDFVIQYWNFEKNDKLGLSPDTLTRGSGERAWFKCPIDGYEWKATITSITSSSWELGNSGCARCNNGWTLDAIKQFVKSLEEHIPNLTQAERYKIFEQAGILGIGNSESLNLIKDIIKGKILVKNGELESVNSVDNQKLTKTGLSADKELEFVDDAEDSEITLGDEIEAEVKTESDTDNLSDLPQMKVQKSLEFLSSDVVATADKEAIDYFIASRTNRIWAEVFEDETAIQSLKSFKSDGYGQQVRDQFLDEYYQAADMQVPEGWAFRLNGKLTPPNLMQKLAAVRLRNRKRMLNLSLTGTGKTIGGILSSRIIDANLTIIVCPLDTVANWHAEIKHVFPDSKVTERNFTPYWLDVSDGHHYIVLNHEMFQQLDTGTRLNELLQRYKIDLIVVDEIHRCKQRGNSSSKRRQMVLGLISTAYENNSELHVLGMSATPIINNLKEGISLVELVTSVEHNDLSGRATLNNCMRLHQTLVTLGIRSRVKPRIEIERIKQQIDCSLLFDEIVDNGTSVLKLEQILTKARIPVILGYLQPKTIVYTHYVDGIIDQLQKAIEEKGWKVGFHIGGDKSGRNEFINGSVDVLIASSAMAVGVDGFQRVCNRMILNIPPWTSAELEQLEGRLNRQGQTHTTLDIIMPITFGNYHGEKWSWDERRYARLQNKQTIADAAVDGVMPEGKLRSEQQAFRDLRGWLDRLRTGEQKPISRQRIRVPIPDDDPSDIKRRQASYGNFSRMNARWNTSYSQTTLTRLKENPEEWMQYHTLYQQSRKTWEIVPYKETIRWLKLRSNLEVGDFGCGEALIAQEVGEQHKVHSFDFVAINDDVTECDIRNVPLEDDVLDVAIFNLALMGKNVADYINEAARVVRLDGQLWIYETEARLQTLLSLEQILETSGFKIIENETKWKFRYIRAIKSYAY